MNITQHGSRKRENKGLQYRGRRVTPKDTNRGTGS